jgi:hypothetical protein
MTIKYETLVSDPGPTLNAIYGFLGLEGHPTTFQATPAHNQKYFAKWRELARDPQTSGIIGQCAERHESRAQRFGYSLRNLE